MGKVVTELSVSLDGFVAGPNDSVEQPLGGAGGDSLIGITVATSHFHYRVQR